MDKPSVYLWLRFGTSTVYREGKLEDRKTHARLYASVGGWLPWHNKLTWQHNIDLVPEANDLHSRDIFEQYHDHLISTWERHAQHDIHDPVLLAGILKGLPQLAYSHTKEFPLHVSA